MCGLGEKQSLFLKKLELFIRPNLLLSITQFDGHTQML